MAADQNSGQERTEQPTAKRLQQAREKGQIARSKELNTLMVMIFAGIALVFFGPATVDALREIIRRGLQIERERMFDKAAVLDSLYRVILDGLLLVAPVFALMIIAAIAGSVALGGFNFSWQALGFKWNKLNPLKGLKRIFGTQGLVEMTKSFFKFMLLAAVAVWTLHQFTPALLGLAVEPLDQAAVHAASMLDGLLLGLVAVLVLITAADVPFQLWQHTKQLKMTRQEIKEEMKETDGNPEVKGKIRALQREWAQRRMMQAIPEASVVITNPTHYAVALRYEDGKTGAPTLVASGVDEVALKIREIAAAHDVPIFAAPPLARAIYHSTELNQEIPTGLYVAVARVLAYIHQLRAVVRNGGMVPETPNDLPIPADIEALARKRQRPA
ncbi:MAG: flagellar biosynthesis protein FlhB [Thiotrichales bacterium]